MLLMFCKLKEKKNFPCLANVSRQNPNWEKQAIL